MAANAAAPSGFQTLRRYDGAVPNYGSREETIAYNYGTRINYGDPVYKTTSGTIALYANGGTTIHGIFRGCRYLDPNTLKTEWYPAWRTPTLPSTTTVFAQVDADPNLTFMAQMIGSALTTSSIGLNMDITAGTSGSTTLLSGYSVCSLSGTAASTNTLPFRIIGIIGNLGGLLTPAINAAYNGSYDNQWLEVVMNTNDMTTRTGQS
jgi:hypothetical protein